MALTEMTLTDSIVPDGFQRFSDAVNRLAEGMWGGLRPPFPVRGVKRTSKNASVIFGPWRQQAGQRLTAAAIAGELPVYLFPESNSPANAPTELLDSIRKPVVLSTDLLKSLVTARNTFPDHPIKTKTSMRIAGDNKKLYWLLKSGIMLLRAEEFDIWYREQRGKKRWPSQTSGERKIGRPSIGTQGLKDAIVAALRERKTGVAELRRQLQANGRTDVPSPDTLARLVDQLHRETGRPELLRKRSRRR
jgi:hypothetical protein